jgi:hypothetical protein
MKAQLYSLLTHMLDTVSQVSLSPRAAIPRPPGMPLLNLSLCNALENSTASVAAVAARIPGDDSDAYTESTLSRSSRSGAASPEPLQKETSQSKLGGLQKETSQSKLGGLQKETSQSKLPSH